MDGRPVLLGRTSKRFRRNRPLALDRHCCLDSTAATFPRNLAADFTHYFCEITQRKTKTEDQPKFMNNQDTGTIIITFLLLLPWIGRLGVSAVAAWRAHTEAQAKKAKQ